MTNFNNERKWFDFFLHFPMISAVLTFVGSLILGIIINPLIIIFGFIFAVIEYILLKIYLSPMVLQIEYLDALTANTEKLHSLFYYRYINASQKPAPSVFASLTFEQKLYTYKEMLDNGSITQEVYKERVTALVENQMKTNPTNNQERK